MSQINPTNVALGILFLLQALGLYSVKRDTRQVNNAVNHVEAGEPKLIDQVRIIRDDQTIMKGKNLEFRDEVNKRFETLEGKQDQSKGQLTELKEHVDKMFDVMPKRKEDHNEI